MRCSLPGGVIVWLLLIGFAWGEDPIQLPPDAPQPPEAPAGPAADPAQGAQGAAAPAPPGNLPKEVLEALERNAQEIKALKEEHAREMERQRKLAELQQQQIEVLERTTRLLASQLKQQGAAAKIEDVQVKTETLDARSKQAARRDVELAGATDDLRESVDSIRRYPSRLLPYTARELFLPTQTNETPLAFYGQILGGYNRQNGQSGNFQSPEFGPWILLQLNRRFLLEVNFDIAPNAVSLGQGQIDWFLTNNLTLSAGRFLTPIGFFNERLAPEWINKLPDIPIMFRQVLPLTSTDGVQLRGARYLGGLPIKMEYSFYGGNGFQLPQSPTKALTPVADLEGLTGGPDENTAKAYGTRLGMWLPLYGVNFGFSGYTNGDYAPGFRSKYSLWDADFNYHRGSWDFRAEYAGNRQQAGPIIGHNIQRQGAYAQIAYRNYLAFNRYLANLEGVFRYSFATFHGINPHQLDQTAFPSAFDVPVSRDQYTLGINYYFYPSMVLKLAYEINRERRLNLGDNIFLAQGVWAF